MVPDGGAELCGHFLPAGTVVGMHAWVIHRDTSIFGEDAESFRPERWLDAEPEALKKMERAFLSVSGTPFRLYFRVLGLYVCMYG